jgi:hypothetical protein
MVSNAYKFLTHLYVTEVFYIHYGIYQQF